jgi:hypothetical protein
VKDDDLSTGEALEPLYPLAEEIARFAARRELEAMRATHRPPAGTHIPAEASTGLLSESLPAERTVTPTPPAPAPASGLRQRDFGTNGATVHRRGEQRERVER